LVKIWGGLAKSRSARTENQLHFQNTNSWDLPPGLSYLRLNAALPDNRQFIRFLHGSCAVINHDFIQVNAVGNQVAVPVATIPVDLIEPHLGDSLNFLNFPAGYCVNGNVYLRVTYTCASLTLTGKANWNVK